VAETGDPSTDDSVFFRGSAKQSTTTTIQTATIAPKKTIVRPGTEEGTERARRGVFELCFAAVAEAGVVAPAAPRFPPEGCCDELAQQAVGSLQPACAHG